MKFSLRVKLFIVMSGLIVFYVMVSWLLNNVMLEKYYFYKKENVLLNKYKFIDSIYHGDISEVSLEFEKLQRTDNLHILIQDQNFETKYNSFPVRKESKQKYSKFINDMQDWPENFIKNNIQYVLNGKIIIVNRKDTRLNTSFITLLQVLNNGDYIYLNTPVAPIEESVRLSNDFFMCTGILTLIIGIILVFLLTRKFTRPILELNIIAQKMAMLDFSNRYRVQTKDEIGELGNSINSLSEQLEFSISELKEANLKLQEDIEKERELDEMRKEFVSSVSHELKTPIALIQGYAEGLKVNVNEDEENKNFYCDVIVDEAYKMNKIVKQLLELSEIESRIFNFEKSDFDIFELIEQTIRKNALVFNEKGVNVHFEKEKSLFVHGDIDRIEQVLMNYINNALNHIDDRKILKIYINPFVECKKVRVFVYNSGHHIPDEEKGKIWTSFYKVDKARTREYGGTGLGLSIVRAVLELHGTDYGVNNVEGGVEFWFDIDY